MQVHIGVVENRLDPLKLGRCQVRVMGIHTHDKVQLPTIDLPWAYPIQPATSAAMNGIGHSPVGPVEGTTVIITFLDNPANQQPLILGTLGGIPQSESVIINRTDDGGELLKDEESGEIAPAEDRVNPAAPVPASSDISASQQKTGIPTTPPSSWKGNRSLAETNIKALLTACNKLGLTTREQQASVLAIVGGECGWIPQSEGYSYSADALKKVFGATDQEAKTYARWQGAKEDFFAWAYAPTRKPTLGNKTTEEAGMYYGRGLIQLTGKYNYNKYQTLLSAQGVTDSILTSPDTLNTNTEVSALAAVLFIQKEVRGKPQPSDNPGYFMGAAKGVNGTHLMEKKKEYYDYFYGESVSIDSRSAAEPAPQDIVIDTYGNSAKTINGQTQVGFKDPNNKYPLKAFMYEPDTNRLARGVSKGTIVSKKELERVRGIPVALSSETFDEPLSPFGGSYPYNHVFESESGHVQEFDDTPGYERTQLYHRKGTYEEVDPNGTKVSKIVGDSYTIIDRNGCIYIAGSANITTDGKINIYCRSDANIEVDGSAKMAVGGNFDISASNNMTIAVGGKFTLYSGGDMGLQAGGDQHIKAGGNIAMDGTKLDLNSGTSSSMTLSPTSLPAPIDANFEYLAAPAPKSTDVYKFETEEEWATPEGQAVKKDLATKHDMTVPPATEEAAPKGNDVKPIPKSCDVIFSTDKFTSDFRLSENFTLGMFFDGGFNNKHKLVAQNKLSIQQIVCNLSQLAQNVLEPYLTELPGGIAGYGKQWAIGSGYRQGTSGSQHNKGQAVDINLIGGSDRKQRTYDLVQKLEAIVPYDQIILEYRAPSSNWIHTSYDGNGGRKMAFTMVNDSTYKRNAAGQPAGFYLV